MLKPTRDWVLTKNTEDNKEKITASGLVLLRAVNKHKIVEIVSFGPEANKSKTLKVGDRVLVPLESGVKATHENEEYEMAKEKNFLGIIE
jgi:co-chaperonin GroES (HSP10)